MLNERLQILVTPEQRRRLEAEAKRRGTSVAGVIRDAIDARLGVVSREERLRALEDIRSARKGRFLSPEELDRISAEQRDKELEGLPRSTRR